MPEPVLVVEGLEKRFGKKRAVNGVDIESPGELQFALDYSEGWDISALRGNRTMSVSIR